MGYIVNTLEGETVGLRNAKSYEFHDGFISFRDESGEAVGSFNSERVISILRASNKNDVDGIHVEGGIEANSGNLTWGDPTTVAGNVVVDNLTVRESLTVEGQIDASGGLRVEIDEEVLNLEEDQRMRFIT